MRTGPTTIVNAADRVRAATGHVLSEHERQRALTELKEGKVLACQCCAALWPASLIDSPAIAVESTQARCPECHGPGWSVAA